MADVFALRGAVAPLDAYHVATRYRYSLPGNIAACLCTRASADDGLRMADQVLELVREKLQMES